MNIKVHCPCGARYSFEVEPVDGQMPYAINCPQCNADGTELANQIIQQSLSETPPAAEKPKVRLHVTASPAPVEAPAVESDLSMEVCNRHLKNAATSHCVVCQKPICTECMSLFGYLCSINCRYQAEQRGITVPFYEFQKTAVEANWWRHIGRIVIGIVLAIAALLGLWSWYAFVLSKPQLVYSLKQAKPFVHAQFVAPNQILLVAEGNIRLHDVKAKKDIWSTKFQETKADAESEKYSYYASMFSKPELFLTKDDVWAGLEKEVICLDKKTGAKKYSIPLTGNHSDFAMDEKSLLVVSETEADKRKLTRIDLATGTAKNEEVVTSSPEQIKFSQDAAAAANPTAASLLKRALSDDPENYLDKMRTEIIPAGQNLVQMEIKLLQANLVTVQAMKKAGPSAINANTSVTTSTRVVAEEIFNDMKRANTGGMKTVNESRYQITLRRLEPGSTEWRGEVVGPAGFFPQKKVDVLTAGKGVYVFDKENKKLFEAKLNFPVADFFISRYEKTDAAPCLETDNTLYFFDQGVLTAFELPSGNIRWRLTSVGISKVQADGKGQLYINTTTASPEDIQYSEQIKMGDPTRAVLLKVDGKSGKILWKGQQAGDATYLSGKYLYITRTQSGGFMMANALENAMGSTHENADHFRIFRLDPGTGRTVWEYYHKGSPEEIDFRENRILLQYPKELKVMKFWSF